MGLLGIPRRVSVSSADRCYKDATPEVQLSQTHTSFFRGEVSAHLPDSHPSPSPRKQKGFTVSLVISTTNL